MLLAPALPPEPLLVPPVEWSLPAAPLPDVPLLLVDPFPAKPPPPPPPLFALPRAPAVSAAELPQPTRKSAISNAALRRDFRVRLVEVGGRLMAANLPHHR
jgi:hypothetical protein